MKKYKQSLLDLENSLTTKENGLYKKVSTLIGNQNEQTNPELRNWIDKVAFHSYKTLDREIDQLKTSGLDEQDIFKATVIAAHLASKSILEKGIKLLKE